MVRQSDRFWTLHGPKGEPSLQIFKIMLFSCSMNRCSSKISCLDLPACSTNSEKTSHSLPEHKLWPSVAFWTLTFVRVSFRRSRQVPGICEWLVCACLWLSVTVFYNDSLNSGLFLISFFLFLNWKPHLFVFITFVNAQKCLWRFCKTWWVF